MDLASRPHFLFAGDRYLLYYLRQSQRPRRRMRKPSSLSFALNAPVSWWSRKYTNRDKYQRQYARKGAQTK